jgi:hypothetical protein
MKANAKQRRRFATATALLMGLACLGPQADAASTKSKLRSSKTPTYRLKSPSPTRSVIKQRSSNSKPRFTRTPSVRSNTSRRSSIAVKKPSFNRPSFKQPRSKQPSLSQPRIGRRVTTPKPGIRIPFRVSPGRVTPFRPSVLKPSIVKQPGFQSTQPTFKPFVRKPSFTKPAITFPLAKTPSNTLADRFKPRRVELLKKTNFGRKLDLTKQLRLLKTGDVSRRLSLSESLHKHGGWRARTHRGLVSSLFTNMHAGAYYPGPSCYPSYCWQPRWDRWVEWCWDNHVTDVCDPRPIVCRPVVCRPCPEWVAWECPTWRPLPIVDCGTWVDVPPLVCETGLDLQMLAVRFIDPGHADQKLGPRYRVWFRNNSVVDIEKPFNVMLFAANSQELAGDLPEAGVRVMSITADEIRSVDIRLPFDANVMGLDDEGNKSPFSQLHVIIDTHREIPEVFEQNNGAVIARGDVLPVDPALFAAEQGVLEVGSVINIAGEGLGPEPGQVLFLVNGLELLGVVDGWYDLGVRVRVPNLPLATAIEAQLVIVRGDGAAAVPLTVQLVPASNAILPAPALP